MIERLIRYAPMLLALGLGSCSQQNAKICDSHYDTVNVQQATWAEKADICIHQWGYRLAVSKDPADTVAGAVLSSCSMAVEMTVAEVHGQEFKTQMDAGSVAFQATSAANVSENEMRAYLKQQALFRVVQARAGHCDVP